MVIATQLPSSFRLSYEESELYPDNLIYREKCTAVLDAYRAKLDEISSTHFIVEGREGDVVFRDFRGQGEFLHYSLEVFSTNYHV